MHSGELTVIFFIIFAGVVGVTGFFWINDELPQYSSEKGWIIPKEEYKKITMTYDIWYYFGDVKNEVDFSRYYPAIKIDWYDKDGERIKVVYPYEKTHGDCLSNDKCIKIKDESQPAIIYTNAYPVQFSLSLDNLLFDSFKAIYEIDREGVLEDNSRVSDYYKDNKGRKLFVLETHSLVYPEHALAHTVIYVPLIKEVRE